jgi:dCMP deaminase|tara:strand:- start:44 stop:544 length:501 start_codon:yes stop_codon:yes gene_type:complete
MKKNEITWDRLFMSMAYLVAMKSEDSSTHVGAVIVGPDNEIVSTGYNGLARGVRPQRDRHKRPEKYHWYAHAERNAVYNAARIGVPLKDCRIYTQWIPCSGCAIAIIQSGIKEVIVHDLYVPTEKWSDSSKRSLEMFDEAGITFRLYEEAVINKVTGLLDGKKFTA